MVPLLPKVARQVVVALGMKVGGGKAKEKKSCAGNEGMQWLHDVFSGCKGSITECQTHGVQMYLEGTLGFAS